MPCARGRGHRPGREDTATGLGSPPGGGGVPDASPPGSQPAGKHENKRQIINNGGKQSAAGCRERQVTAPACSPYGRDAAFISYKEIPAMETLCSSGAAGSLRAHLCLSKDRKWQSSKLQSRGGAWEGQGIPGHRSRAGNGWAAGPCGEQSSLRQLLAPHTNGQCFPRRQRGRRAPFLLHPGRAGMSCTWMVKAAFSPSSCEERSPRTAPAWKSAAQHLPSVLT